jgi:glycosyltransferase involved in cell wall biosynthesis
MVVYNKYPADPRVRRAAESLVAVGYKVHVICTSEQGAPLEDEFNGVTIHRIPVLKDSGVKIANFIAVAAFMFRAAGKVLSVRRRFRPAYYHVHSLPDFLIAVVLIPRILGARLVLDLHESFPEIVRARFKTGAGLLARIAGWIERLSCMVSDRVIVVNDTIAGLVIKRGERADKVTVIMNSPEIRNTPIPQDQLHPQVEAARRLGSPLFVYAGGINEDRDIKTLIEAISLLQKESIELHALLYTHTETPYLEEIQAYIRKLSLEEIVQFCGYLQPESVLANLRASSLGIVTYVLSPLTEIALPNKVFEYIAVNCPIVVADLPTLKTLLDDAAYYYTPGNPSSLSEAIKAALYDHERITKIKKAKIAYEKCAWDVMNMRLLDVYDKLKNNKLSRAQK